MSTRSSSLLLRVRALQELVARREVAHAQQEQREAEDAVTDAEVSLAELLVPTAASTPSFLAVVAAQRSGAVLVSEHRSLARLAAERAAAARDAWLDAEARRSSVEHLDSALRDRERLDRERDEQRATDDLVSARHGRGTAPTTTPEDAR